MQNNDNFGEPWEVWRVVRQIEKGLAAKRAAERKQVRPKAARAYIDPAVQKSAEHRSDIISELRRRVSANRRTKQVSSDGEKT